MVQFYQKKKKKKEGGRPTGVLLASVLRRTSIFLKK